MQIPPVGYYRRIKDNASMKVVRYSEDKTVIYVAATNFTPIGHGQPWAVFTENFWKYYEADKIPCDNTDPHDSHKYKSEYSAVKITCEGLPF